MRTYDKDPTHVILTEQAKAQLADSGKFTKHDVIVDAGLGKFEDKITDLVNWPHVRDRVELESGALVPISMESEGKWDPGIHPEKFLAGGRRKTDGWVMPMEMPQVALEYATRRVNAVIGAANKANAIMLSFEKAGLPIAYQPAKVPVLELRAAAE